MGRIIAFTNQKGGVGKTTTCVNMSTYMALMGKKVLIVDIDPQGNSTSGLGLDKSDNIKTIYDALAGNVSVNEVIQKTEIEGLDIIPANQDLAGIEVELVYTKQRENVLKNLLSQVKNKYDFITLDCAPSLGLLTVNALTSADSVMIPIQCEFFALEGLSQLMNTIRLIKKTNLNPNLKVEGVVLTMRDSRSNLGRQVAEEIGKFFGSSVFNTTIPRNVRLAEAPSYGKPIYLYDKNCSGSVAYLKLTEEFFTRNGLEFKKISKRRD